jgi:thiol-disulfide isomerase/thioredoxin
MAKLTFTDADFDKEVLQETAKPVLVDFWASWCGPCVIQRPVVDQLATEYEGRVKIGELDVDANPRATQQFSVLGDFQGWQGALAGSGGTTKAKNCRRAESRALGLYGDSAR